MRRRFRGEEAAQRAGAVQCFRNRVSGAPTPPPQRWAAPRVAAARVTRRAPPARTAPPQRLQAPRTRCTARCRGRRAATERCCARRSGHRGRPGASPGKRRRPDEPARPVKPGLGTVRTALRKKRRAKRRARRRQTNSTPATAAPGDAPQTRHTLQRCTTSCTGQSPHMSQQSIRAGAAATARADMLPG